jgi:hypothetical protein
MIAEKAKHRPAENRAYRNPILLKGPTVESYLCARYRPAEDYDCLGGDFFPRR